MVQPNIYLICFPIKANFLPKSLIASFLKSRMIIQGENDVLSLALRSTISSQFEICTCVEGVNFQSFVNILVIFPVLNLWIITLTVEFSKR